MAGQSRNTGEVYWVRTHFTYQKNPTNLTSERKVHAATPAGAISHALAQTGGDERNQLHKVQVWHEREAPPMLSLRDERAAR